MNVPASVYDLAPSPVHAGNETMWGAVTKTEWCTDSITLADGTYLYRFEITGPDRDSGNQVRSLYFGDPCARETDEGVFSVVRIPGNSTFTWDNDAYRVPPLNEVILYEMNVAEFGGTFTGVANRISPLDGEGGDSRSPQFFGKGPFSGIPFGHAGQWADVLEASYEHPEPPYWVTVTNTAGPLLGKHTE